MPNYHSYIVIIFAILCFTAIIILVLFNKNRKRKKMSYLKLQWGKQVDKYRDIGLISLYYDKVRSKLNHNIDDRTWSDLDMDNVFSEIDFTISKIGEQKLYQTIHSQKLKINKLKEFDKMVQYYNDNQDIRINVQMVLSKLTNRSLYFFPDIFSEKILSKPFYYFIYPFLSILSLALIVICFFLPHLIWVLIINFILCIVLHYINKIKIGSYIDSFQNISKIINTLIRLKKINLKYFDSQMIDQDIQKCRKITQKTRWLSFDYIDTHDITGLFYMIFELLKGVFLLETILFYSALEHITKCKNYLENFYNVIGDIDTAISVASFRHSLKIFCKPKFNKSSTNIYIKDIYHPLIANCIENTISINRKSVLITGSNMAGKSTFIRAVGINAILSQSIYTAICNEYNAPFMKVLSSINISDDIKAGKSYFLDEINSIKRLIVASQKEDICLFIIDEIFKGTNTFDRIAAAKSVLSFLAAHNNIVFVSTHDIELTNLLNNKFDLYYFQDNISNDQLIFDYKLNKGIPLKSNALRLLEINNYPSNIIQEALQYKKNTNRSGWSD